MKSRLIEPDPESREAMGIWRRFRRIRTLDRPLTARNIALSFCENALILVGLVFGTLRETLRAIIMITDPDRVRETLGLRESDSGVRRVTHD